MKKTVQNTFLSKSLYAVLCVGLCTVAGMLSACEAMTPKARQKYHYDPKQPIAPPADNDEDYYLAPTGRDSSEYLLLLDPSQYH